MSSTYFALERFLLLTISRRKQAIFWFMSVVLVIGLAIACLLLLERGLRFVATHHGNRLNSLNERSIILPEGIPGSSVFYRPEGIYLSLLAESHMPSTGVTESFDDNGFMQPSGAPTSPRVKIAFVGGSTTQNIHVPPLDKYAYLVGRMLSIKANCSVGVYNAGLSGNDSIADLNILVNKILPLHPDFVVFMENINDLQKLIATGGYWNDPDVRPYLQPKNTVSAGAHSLAAQTVPYTIHQLGQIRRPPLADDWQTTRGKRRVVDTDSIAISQRAALTSLLNVAQAWRIRPVVIVPPNRFKFQGATGILARQMDSYQRDYGLTPAQFFEIYSGANQIIRQVANDRGAILIDLDESIAPQPRYIYDWVHMSIEGSHLAASLITARLLPIMKSLPQCYASGL